MAYTINLTNGTSLLPGGLSDGTVNTSNTSLTLIGRDYAGYGQFLNENFVYLLENFANGTSPANPLKGQLWFDSINNVLRVYSGVSWKISTGATSSTAASPPTDLSNLGGDLWYDSTNAQLKVYSGSQWIVVGPPATASTGDTGATPVIVTDTSSGQHACIQFKIRGVVYAILSKDTFTSTVSGFTTIKAGMNFSSIASPTMVLNTQDVNATPSTLVQRDGVGNINVAGITATGTITAGAIIASSITTAGGGGGGATWTGNVAGNVAGTYGSFTTVTTQGLSVGSSLTPSANVSVDIGSVGSWFNNIYGTAIHAKYADLAERFHADAEYAPGTVVEMGGTAEITKVVAELSNKVFGVISTNAAYLMNSSAGSNLTHPPVAMSGRVPVRAIGLIAKGDRLVSAGNGVARSGKQEELTPWNVIGRSLVDKTEVNESLIEAIVKINS
jgi:hypothetical protein